MTSRLFRIPIIAVSAATLALTGCAPAHIVSAPAPSGSVSVAAHPSAQSVPVPAAFRDAVDRGTRTETGQPGPNEWQQHVAYRIDARLEPEAARVRGSQRIVYHNNSPDVLESIALNLYQNVFSEGVPRNRYSPITGGITLERVAVRGQAMDELAWRNRNAAAGYAVQGTIGWIRLPQPLSPGDSIEIDIDWHFIVPPETSYRTGWQDAHGGRAFVIAQWYPQVAVYDDLRGWDATPYLGDGEFYLEYGDFDVTITVPEGWLVGASGELENAGEVLTDAAVARLRDATGSTETVAIVTREEMESGRATRPAADGSHTWRFRATNVRDFAFATSDRYVWNLRYARTGGGEASLPIHALYRPGARNWQRAAEFGAHTMEFLSATIVPYPYPQVTIAEGPIGGMEYPQIMFIGGDRSPESLYGVIAHEAVHFWFPMVVGSDEARYAWMDEGMANYYSDLSSADFFGSDPYAGNRRSYLSVAGSEAEVPLMRHTDLVTPYGARGVAAYSKPATLMLALREVIGAQTFDAAIQQYIADWSYRHPAPWDFFNAMERAAGEDLDWFFGPWWFGTEVLDQAIGSVEPAGDRVRITVEDRGGIRMPVLLRVVTADGNVIDVELPVSTWDGRTAVAELEVTGEIVSAVIDPENVFPDVARANNSWEGAR